MDPLLIVGYLAATANTIEFLPEVLKALRTHHLEDLSWAMMGLLCFSNIMWGIFGLHLNDIPLIACSLINGIMQWTLVILKFRYQKNKKPLFAKAPKLANEAEVIK